MIACLPRISSNVKILILSSKELKSYDFIEKESKNNKYLNHIYIKRVNRCILGIQIHIVR